MRRGRWRSASRCIASSGAAERPRNMNSVRSRPTASAPRRPRPGGLLGPADVRGERHRGPVGGCERLRGRCGHARVIVACRLSRRRRARAPPPRARRRGPTGVTVERRRRRPARCEQAGDPTTAGMPSERRGSSRVAVREPASSANPARSVGGGSAVTDGARSCAMTIARSGAEAPASPRMARAMRAATSRTSAARAASTSSSRAASVAAISSPAGPIGRLRGGAGRQLDARRVEQDLVRGEHRLCVEDPGLVIAAGRPAGGRRARRAGPRPPRPPRRGRAEQPSRLRRLEPRGRRKATPGAAATPRSRVTAGVVRRCRMRRARRARPGRAPVLAARLDPELVALRDAQLHDAEDALRRGAACRVTAEVRQRISLGSRPPPSRRSRPAARGGRMGSDHDRRCRAWASGSVCSPIVPRAGRVTRSRSSRPRARSRR